MVRSISQGTGSGLFDVFRSPQKEQGKLPDEATIEAVAFQAVSVHAASSNVMSRNFASTEREESMYLKARQAGQEAANKQASRQMAILNAGLAELAALGEGNGGGYAIRSLIGRKTARRMQEEGQQAVSEVSERNFKEIKEGIEQKAQEAMAPKDENGNPVETGLPAERAGEAVPVAEISDSNPVPAPEASADPASDAAQAAPPARDVFTPSAPSLDITV